MNCEILETLYVRSNGDIPCNDDVGEQVLLGRVEADSDWSISSVLQNDRFTHIRRSLGAGIAPWSECGDCAWLREHEEYSDPLARKRLRKLQVESSLRCALRCPGCSNGVQSATRPRPHLMPVELYGRLIDSLSDEGFSVEEIEYCGQGEPLLHPKFPEFLWLTRQSYPDGYQRVITSGNVGYAKSTGREGVNEIYVSCDGVHQESYEKYRIGGQVERALQFLRDAPRVENGVRQKLIWKYILFEFNDSIEEIELAQHMAQDLEVDTLVFVLTHSCHRSERWTADNASELPILYPNVTTSVTPVQERDAVGLTPVDHWQARGRGRKQTAFGVEWIAAHLDHLEFAGWAARQPAGIDSIDVAIDGRVVGSLRSGLARSDIAGFFPELGPQTGFSGRISTAIPADGTHSVDLLLRGERGRPVRVGRRYRFGSSA